MRRTLVRSLLSLFFAILILAFPSAFAKASADDPAFASPQGEGKAGSVDEVVVTATRIPAPLREVGGTVTVITRDEIEEKGTGSVARLLREVPGVDVVQQGPPGGLTRVFLRGGNSNHTLVLIDGVEAHDPASPDGAFDFSSLDAEGIERIEILSGPQGTLYGSAALGGVVSITTRRGEGPARGTVSLGSGSFRSQRQAASWSGGGPGEKGLDWFLSFRQESTEGFSAADAAQGNTEADGVRERAVSARVGRGEPAGPGWDLLIRSSESARDLDDFNAATFLFSDDPDSRGEARELLVRGQARLETPAGWRQTLALSVNRVVREDDNPPDPVNPADFSSRYRGESAQAEWRNRIELAQGRELLFGIEARAERAQGEYSDRLLPFLDDRFDDRSHSEAAYLQGRLRLAEGLTVAAGGRGDRYPGFGTEGTWSLSASLRLAPLRLKGSYGTGFKAPTLYQLHSAQYGNPDLEAERSAGWEAGVEAPLAGPGSSIGVTWFDNRVRDLIGSGPAWTFVNIARARSSGLEGKVTLPITGELRLHGGYTLTRTRDEGTGQWLLRRPREKVQAGLELRTGEAGAVRLDGVWVGKRLDYIGWSVGTLPGYSVMDLAVSQPLGRGVTATLRVENLLDERYQETAGYGAAGRSGELGLKVDF